MARVAVLVEGQSDRAAVLALATRGVGLADDEVPAPLERVLRATIPT